MRGRIIQLSRNAFAVMLLGGAMIGQQSSPNSNKGTVVRTLPRNTTTSPNVVQQPVFYAGRVMLDTGIAPPSPAAIVRICNGISRRETLTAPDGSFSFMLGDRYSEVIPDASDDTRNFSADTQFSRGMVTSSGQNPSQSVVTDCEIHADLGGYTSSSIHLDPSLNNANIGIIMLHSRTKKAEGMVTVASLAVPSKARHEFEKGSEELEKGKLPEAEKALQKAIDDYPKFAEAWTRMGDLEERRKNTAAAEKDYQQAIESDQYLPLPYLRLAFLNAVASHWDEARQLTEKVISLDPTDFMMAYYYNAVAEFNLNHVAKAETSALHAEKMDGQHSEPRIELLLASIYVSKESYATAADHYRAFLKMVPDGPISDRVKNDLAKVDQLAQSKPPAAPTPAPTSK
jgi:cytochrome c-type biogenesis protein CcmH/NrfG